MNKLLFYKEKHLLLINFDIIFSSIQVDCLNELQDYGLVKDYHINLSKSDVKKVIYHHVIHGICEEIRLNKHKDIKVIVIPPTFRPFHEIVKFCNPDILQRLMLTLIKRISNSLPFLIYFADEYIFENESPDTGKLEDLLNILVEKSHNLRDKSFTFEKIKKFTAKFDLDFLSQEYFNCIKTKLLLH